MLCAHIPDAAGVLETERGGDLLIGLTHPEQIQDFIFDLQSLRPRLVVSTLRSSGGTELEGAFDCPASGSAIRGRARCPASLFGPMNVKPVPGGARNFLEQLRHYLSVSSRSTGLRARAASSARSARVEAA